MTQDKFVKRNQLISQHLEQIALHRGYVGSKHSLIPTSHAFRELLVAQERLLLAAERMLDSDAHQQRAA
jgi:hypothetical protein